MKKDIKLSPEVLKKYNFNKNEEYFSHLVKDDNKDRIEVEIGDAKQSDFKPQIKIKRWDNEVNFSLRAEENKNAVVETHGEKIIYKHPDYDVEMFDKPEVGEDGGLEFQWVLNKKPKTNFITATIQTKELDFFYQPEIYDEEAQPLAHQLGIPLLEAKRKMRPENVVGSYAVYHKSKRDNLVGGKEYKTGKAFHIYRPHITDSNGLSSWGELHIDVESGILTVIINQEFLDKAVYPVVVDPTFGYTGNGASSSPGTNNYFYGSIFTSPSDAGEVTGMSVYGSDQAVAGTYAYFKGLLVLHSTLAIISNGISNQSDTQFQYAGWSWRNATFSTNPTLAASTAYVVGAVFNGNGGYVGYDAGDADQGHSETDNNYASPTNPSSITHSTNKYSIYATYTVFSLSNSVKSNIISTYSKPNNSSGDIKTTYYCGMNYDWNPVGTEGAQNRGLV